MAQYLSQHPSIIQPQRKDIYFFNNSVNYSKGKSWYKAHFAHSAYQFFYEKKNGISNPITFDSTPNYFASPVAASRLKEHYPNAKLILLLRNPIERAWSNYRMCVWHKFESLSFEDALKYEDERMKRELVKMLDVSYHSYIMQRLSYRSHGVYANYLEEWFKHFSREQFLILKSEDLFSEPEKIYSAVIDFLKLPKFIGGQFENYNKGKIEDGIPASSRKELAEFYKPHNERLYSLINRNMNWS